MAAKYFTSREKVERFMDSVLKKFRQQSDHKCDYRVFDCTTVSLFLYILNGIANNDMEYFKCSATELARKLNKPKPTIQRRVRLLCSLGFVTYSSFYDAEKKRKTVSVYRLNPAISLYFKTGTSASIRLKILDASVKMHNRRLLEYDYPMQGFRSDVSVGTVEAKIEFGPQGKEVDEDAVLNTLAESISKEDIEKGQKLKENQRWKEYGDAWVGVAKDIWVNCNTRKGRGSELPIWYGDTANMPAMACKERRELTKTLEKFGGKISVLAWFVYCGSYPRLDQKNKPVFDPNMPHTQWTGVDKRPSVFVKYFDAIIKDKNFHALAQRSDILDVMKENYGELIGNIPPKDGGSELSAIGYIIGGMKDDIPTAPPIQSPGQGEDTSMPGCPSW